MRYLRHQFDAKFYRLWELGRLLPFPENASVFTVKYRCLTNECFSRVTLKATSISDALERACYAVTYSSEWNPEEIDLQAVYDVEENLIWIDEFFYNIVQKKHEFRGMERRELLARFGATSAALLFGLKPSFSYAGNLNINLSGTSSGFVTPTGNQLYTTPGSYTWTAPAGVSSITAACIGGAGAGGTWGGGGGGGGGYCKKTAIAVSPGSSFSIIVGSGGLNRCCGGDIASSASSFSSILTANAGYSIIGPSKTGGSGGTASGGSINYNGGTGGNGMVGGPYGPNGGGGRWGGGGGAAGSPSGNGGNGASGNGSSSATGGSPAVSSFDSMTFGAGGTGSTENGSLGSSGNPYGGGAGGYFHDGTSGGSGLVRVWW